MVQFFFRFNGTKVCNSDDPSYYSIRRSIANCEHIPEEELVLIHNGRLMQPNDKVADFSSIEVSLRLLGGKGGYGNMLKKKAKVTNPNATLDFSACRDLNGRHMRFVNALVAIQKWKERQDRLEELKATNPNAILADVEMDAPKAGIVGWYSDVPCWAEGVKKSRAVYLRQQKKQKMCDLWWKAHQSGKVPPNADKNWGCPRGDQCDFAHGIDELTGEGRDRFLREQQLLKKQEKEEAIEAYTTLEDMSIGAFDALDANYKPKKTSKRKKTLSFGELDDMGFDFPRKKTKPTPATTPDSFRKKLSLLCGEATIQEDGIITASSAFPSIQLGAIRVVSGRYYFEVHLLTEGLVQIGWASQEHGCSEEEENGVGDSDGSWGYDVARGRKWHGEEEEAYGEACQPGDVVGCIFDADRRTLEYVLNGKSLGVAFTGVSAIGGLYPVISLEKDEGVLVNLGQFQFEYSPMEKCKSIWEFAKKVTM